MRLNRISGSCTAGFALAVAAILAVLLAVPVSVLADEAPEEAPVIEEAAPVAEIQASAAMVDSDRNIHQRFYRAFNQVIVGKFGEAAEGFDRLRKLAAAQGYSGMPDYSLELLSQAAQPERTQVEVRFLVNSAVTLSPQDSRVNIIAASFYENIGREVALGYAWQSLLNLPRHPLLLAAVLINVFFVSLVAATLAVFVTCVVQLLRSGRDIFEWALHSAPSSAKGISSAVFLAVVLIVPPFAGILPGIFIWALILSLVKPGCRWLAALTGALVLCWGLAIPVVDTVGRNSEREAYNVIESINNFNFTPKGEQFVEQQLRITPDEPLMLFALGELFQMKNRPDEALEVYQRLIGSGAGKDDMYAATMLNVGVIEYRKGNFVKAKEIFSELEKRRDTSLELYYNLALAHLALLDTNLHRSYYEKAKGVDVERLMAIERQGGEKPQPLMASVSRQFYYPLLTRPIESLEPEALPQLISRRAQLAASLINFGDELHLTIFGAVALLIGVLAGGKMRRRKSVEIKRETPRPSPVWNFIPAGGSLAGERPLPGAAVLMVFMILLMLGHEAPLNFYKSLPVEVSFQTVFVGAAAALFAASAAASLAAAKLAGRSAT